MPAGRYSSSTLVGLKHPVIELHARSVPDPIWRHVGIKSKLGMRIHDFPGIKPTCSLIRCRSTDGAILFRMSVCTVYTCDIGGI